MILKKIKSAGIAHNSYLVGSDNDAVVIDPRRDCHLYADYARQKELKIRYIFETHRHEDFVVGSIDLGKITGAEIYHGPGPDWKYGTTLADGQSFQVGNIRLTAMCTPGHTDESMCYALADLATGESAVAVFTGDTLFVGEVGRTDLYGLVEVPRLASNLYDSIFNKLLPLGDGVIIYPAHGGGSVCGAHIADREESTIGIERKRNPVLQMTNKDAFIKYKIAEKLERPPYFRQVESYNLAGLSLREGMPLPAPLTPGEFRAEIEKGALVVDTRGPAAFGGVHIEGAYSIWLEGLPNFAGWVLPNAKPLLLVIEDQAQLKTAVSYLFRIGYDRISGYLKGGIESWYNAGYPIQSLGLLSVHQLKNALDKGEEMFLLDTRGQEEWESGHIDDALHIYIGHLEERLSEVPRDKTVAVYCASGHRAGLGASILLRAGYPRVYNVPGSIRAWMAAGFPVTKDLITSSSA